MSPPVIRRRRRRRFPSLASALFAGAAWLLAAATPAGAQPVAAPAAGDPCAEGLRLFQSRDLAGAEPLLRRCVQARPTAETLTALAAISSLARRPAEAGELAARAVELDTVSVEARYWLGRALLENGDSAGARREWQRALHLSTDHPGVLEGLARLAVETGETAQAYGLLTQLVRTGKAQGWTHRMLADLARRKRMWGDALRHWRDAMAVEGEDAASLLRAGELAILAGDTTSAVESARRAVALEPTGTSYGGLGEALFAARRYAEAEKALRRAVELAPAEPRNHFNLANVLELQERGDEAGEHFRRFVELDPDDAIGRFNYGIHLDKRGRTVEALTQIEAAARLAPDMMTAQVVRGQLLESLGRWDEAIAAIDIVRKSAPDDSVRLLAWHASVTAKRQEDAQAQARGLVHLLHIVTADTTAVRLLRAELKTDADFAGLATRFSAGPTAAQGGDIGRISPDDLVEPLRTAVRGLALDEVTPPLESRGLWHVFKRIR